jgi:hypothetical protein|eukprot:COSAG01_NODE_6562_length_3608_cov_4.538900_6_plen_95_part_00
MSQQPRVIIIFLARTHTTVPILSPRDRSARAASRASTRRGGAGDPRQAGECYVCIQAGNNAGGGEGLGGSASGSASGSVRVRVEIMGWIDHHQS